MFLHHSHASFSLFVQSTPPPSSSTFLNSSHFFSQTLIFEFLHQIFAFSRLNFYSIFLVLSTVEKFTLKFYNIDLKLRDQIWASLNQRFPIKDCQKNKNYFLIDWLIFVFSCSVPQLENWNSRTNFYLI